MTQLNVKTKQSSDLVVKKAKQSGFMILMSLLILVLGAAAWFGSQGSVRSEKIKQDIQGSFVSDLEYVKQRMLTYAVLHPELFDESTAATVDLTIPGPGYFPCPDTTGDGISDAGPDCSRLRGLYAMGWVPQKIIGRNFSFLSTTSEVERKRYWFAVDTRFLVDARKYRYDNFTRFAPLNINTPSLVPRSGFSQCDDTPGNAITANCVPPLTLDGRGDIVMVIFYSGEPTNSSFRVLNTPTSPAYVIAATAQISKHLEQPQPGTWQGAYLVGHPSVTGEFISRGGDVEGFNDQVIAITREEWNAVMLSRVARDDNNDGVPDLCVSVNEDATVEAQDSWFNQCRYTGNGAPSYADGGLLCQQSIIAGEVENIEGQNWRDALGCPL